MPWYDIQTNRLGMRNWQMTDLPALAKLNQDAEVMRYFPSTLTTEQSKAMILRFQRHYETHGFTYYAVDRLDTAQCIGFIGLHTQTYESFFTPCVDIGWRLGREHWGKGFATEGARACLAHAFEVLGLKEIYSVASMGNIPSIRVMQKIGMTYAGQVDHPQLPVESGLNPCVVYQKLRSTP